MKQIVGFAVLVFWLALNGGAVGWAAQSNSSISANDVVWTTLGHNENDSMPIGNGDLAANVWTEQNGDIVLLLAKSDAWSETGRLLKLGRVRIRMNPNPFVEAQRMTQTLRLEDGTIELRSGADVVQIWVDANRAVIHVQAKFKHAAELQAKLELWRTSPHSYDQPSADRGGLFEFGGHSVPVAFEADTTMPVKNGRVAWFHYNQTSIYPVVLRQEHLESIEEKYADPLLHRCFGAAMGGEGLTAVDDRTVRSSAPSRELQFAITAFTEANAASAAAWKAHLDARIAETQALSMSQSLAEHKRWWQEFWDRSWIRVEGGADAANVSQGYAMQRYMMACSSRGAFPAKFNGGLFTVGRDLAAGKDSTNAEHGPDYRAWGSSYWNQNNRLLYWPLIATGDFDLLKPWFEMYLNALPMAEDRTKIYYHHRGAAFIETGYFWGLPNLNDFGWDNPTNVLKSAWMRYHIQGTLEVIAQMLDEYDVTGDSSFARKQIVPFADSILTYYDVHWPHAEDGKLRLTPVQSLETYQVDAVNPTPDIAGMKHVLTRLLALPSDSISKDQRTRWEVMLHNLPPIPVGKTASGKLPPFGKGDADGVPTILPAEHYGKTSNRENPELYVAFPYRLFGVGKPDLTLARNTFAARRFPWDVCWGQDGPQAAVLGLTDVAKKAATHEFTDYGDQRFKWFWKAGGDWIPDLDDGGTGMMTLQLMLMQTDGDRVLLLPAWPKEWSADFKLHAPQQTVVEGRVERGKLVRLHVTPESRTKDVVNLGEGLASAGAKDVSLR